MKTTRRHEVTLAGVKAFAFSFLKSSLSRAKKILALSKSNEMDLQSVIDSLVSFVSVLKPDGTFISANEATLRSLNLTHSQVVGMHFAQSPWFKHLEADRSQVEEALAKARSGQISRLEIRVSSTQYKMLDVDLIMTPLFDKKGNVTHLVPSGTDVTERKRREEDFKKAEQAAELANEAKTLFLANMSHEIRTPLGIMLGFTELLRDPVLIADEKEQYINSIIRNGHQLTRIINEVLDVSKIESKKLEIEKVDFSLKDLMADVLSLVEFQSREKGLSFNFSSQNQPNWINSDPTRIRQILINIIGNAVKFTSKGKVEVQLRTEPVAQDARKTILIFDVTDTGPGINFEQSQNLFRPFSQADSSMTRKFGGTGLGLYLSRRLTGALGGDLDLITPSTHQTGAHFRVKIPVRLAAERVRGAGLGAGLSPGSHREKSIESDESLKGTRILVIEDSIENQHLITRYLRYHQAQVDCADNGLVGSEKALTNYYDLILMDIQMPVLDGYDTIQRLRDANYMRPVVALTAHAFLNERERCFELGFDEHLVKPIDRRILLETVKRYALPTRETQSYQEYAL